MGRLTERYTNKGISGICLKALDYKGNTADIALVLERLAEFEDFMEEQGFEDLEHLKLRLCNLSNGAKYYAKWQELKELIKKDITDNQIQYNETYITAFKHYSSAENWVLDRMEELEK